MPFELPALAGSTGAILASIRQADALAYAGAEHGFARFDGERAPAGQDRDLEGHRFGILGRLQAVGAPILPSNQNPARRLARALSPSTRADRRLWGRRHRVWCVRCGTRSQLTVLSASGSRAEDLRASGVRVLRGDLDQPRSLRRLAGLATRVLHLAPPPSEGWTDPAHACAGAGVAPAFAAAGAGLRLDQWRLRRLRRRPGARNPAGARRYAARAPAGRCRTDGAVSGALGPVRTSILRIPGIYAPDRSNGTPRTASAGRAHPVLRAQDDVYHQPHPCRRPGARLCCGLVAWREPQRVYNVNDDTRLKMGDYFDLAADLYGLPRPPRLARDVARDELPLGAAQFHGRVATHGQHAAQARAEAAPALPDGEPRACWAADPSRPAARYGVRCRRPCACCACGPRRASGSS